MSFLVEMFNYKAPFLTKKTRMKSEADLCREAIENVRGKVSKESSIIDGNWSSAKLFIV